MYPVLCTQGAVMDGVQTHLLPLTLQYVVCRQLSPVCLAFSKSLPKSFQSLFVLLFQSLYHLKGIVGFDDSGCCHLLHLNQRWDDFTHCHDNCQSVMKTKIISFLY